jgi:hypothetical protein
MLTSPVAESYMYLNSFPYLILVDDLLFHNRCLMLIKLLWHINPLLRNDHETVNYTTAIC